MKKPHEQEWFIACGVVRNENGLRIATVQDSDSDALISIAPVMARALMRRLSADFAPCVCHLTTPERCNNCEDRAILREAGVLP